MKQNPESKEGQESQHPSPNHPPSEQEEFWRGAFGDSYIDRNSNKHSQTLSMGLVVEETRSIDDEKVHSVLELGSNVGLNLKVLQLLYPEADFSAVEINKKAVEELQKLNLKSIYNGSILDFAPLTKFDLVLVRGVLIHINPEDLPRIYEIMDECTGRYLLISEYYSPEPIAVEYHGFSNKLFKRDFAGEFLKDRQGFILKDYGFHYRNGNRRGNDATWFLLERMDS